MTLGQGVDLARLFNREPSGSVATLEILEAVDGDSARAGGELEQAALLFSIPRSNDFPKVLNDFVLLLVATVVGVFLPVLDVDIGDTTDQQLQFSLVENIDEVCGDQLIEAGDESIELLLNPFLNFPFGDESTRG